MTAEELPFLAELIDVKSEHARWRTAIEVVLAASARLLLVPDDKLRAFSTAIDPLQLRGRITFEGVPLYVPVDSPEVDGARIAGKIEFRESPFTGWVRRRVSDPAHNALCAEDAADLDGPGLRVTLAGQTRRGMRGSHGRTETANIIGFSNADAITEIDAELEQLEPQLAQLDRRRQSVDDERAIRDRCRRAYEAVLGTRWDDIDVGGCEARIPRARGHAHANPDGGRPAASTSPRTLSRWRNGWRARRKSGSRCSGALAASIRSTAGSPSVRTSLPRTCTAPTRSSEYN